MQITNQREAASSSIFRHKEFNLQSLGIGGLSDEFADIFRRAFASRVLPAHVTNKYKRDFNFHSLRVYMNRIAKFEYVCCSRLGIKHVKGMLLYGPPGTGKTLIARQIGKMLNGKDPKVWSYLPLFLWHVHL